MNYFNTTQQFLRNNSAPNRNQLSRLPSLHSNHNLLYPTVNYNQEWPYFPNYNHLVRERPRTNMQSIPNLNAIQNYQTHNHVKQASQPVCQIKNELLPSRTALATIDTNVVYDTSRERESKERKAIKQPSIQMQGKRIPVSQQKIGQNSKRAQNKTEHHSFTLKDENFLQFSQVESINFDQEFLIKRLGQQVLKQIRLQCQEGCSALDELQMDSNLKNTCKKVGEWLCELSQWKGNLVKFEESLTLEKQIDELINDL